MSSNRFSLEILELELKTRMEADPAESYTARLKEKGPGKIGCKVIEEAGEVIVAALDETQQRQIEESADLIYHLMVLNLVRGIAMTDVYKELDSRRKG